MSTTKLNPIGLLKLFNKNPNIINTFKPENPEKFGDINFDINNVHFGVSFDIADLLLIISILLLMLAVVYKKGK
jgi:hypothetical protein